MTDSFDKIGCVALYAGRIKFYANAIVELHEFGTEPGLDEEPWRLAYQRRAVKVYLEVLPPEYLEQLASEFLGCSATMAAQPDPPVELAESWRIVDAYFSHGARAIADALEVTVKERWEDPTGKEPTTPAGVGFATLATYITTDAARRLCEAGTVVASWLAPVGRACPLSAEEMQILVDLAEGRSLLVVATDLGLAERTLYRRLKKLYSTMNVSNREQAIALAAMSGWLS